MEEIIKEIKESIFVKNSILESKDLLNDILTASKMVVECYNRKNKTIFAGNGGSAADSQHLAAEFVSRFYFDRPALSSIALTTDTSALTAIGNDYGFERLFERQIQANGVAGDIFFPISTSGNSPNIIRSILKAKENDIYVIGLTGNKESKMSQICDLCIKVPSIITPRIQESHILIGHIICGYVEKKLFS
tara:strand:+ start:28174 stop:28746 length:573 start_codon:yes stop_codon:yes gene_type:complete